MSFSSSSSIFSDYAGGSSDLVKLLKDKDSILILLIDFKSLLTQTLKSFPRTQSESDIFVVVSINVQMYTPFCCRKSIELRIKRPGFDTSYLTLVNPLSFLGFSFLICKVKLIILAYLKGGCENQISKDM